MHHGGRVPKAYLDGRARRMYQQQAPKVIERNVQLIHTNFEFSGNTTVRANKEILPVGRGQLKLGDCSTFIGEWDQEGNPIGDISWTCITNEKAIHYQGSMKKVVEYYGKADKHLVTYIPSGYGTKVTEWHAHIELEPVDARKCEYVGNWLDGELDGDNGCLTTDDSCVRNGTFAKDEIVYGEIYFVTLQNGVLQLDPTADHYTGAFHNGRPHGHGRSVGLNNEKIPCVMEGQFKDGLIYDGTVVETDLTSTSERLWQKG